MSFARTTPRSPTRTVITALCSVAGSSTVHCVLRARHQSTVGEHAATGSATGPAPRAARASRCACRRRSVIASVSRYVPPGCDGRSSVPLTVIGPVPGSSEKSNDRSMNAVSTRAVVRIVAAVSWPSSEHLQTAVLLQLEAVIGSRRLADGEADLLAAVVDAAPDRGRAVAREIGRKVGRRRLHVRAIDEHRHRRQSTPTRTRNASGRVSARGRGLKSVISDGYDSFIGPSTRSGRPGRQA